MEKYLKHLIFWPVCIFLLLGCFELLPLPLSNRQFLGLICIWGGLTGFLGFCPIPLTQDYTNDFSRFPYLLFLPLGVLQVIFQFGSAFLLLSCLVFVAIRLFDHT